MQSYTSDNIPVVLNFKDMLPMFNPIGITETEINRSEKHS